MEVDDIDFLENENDLQLQLQKIRCGEVFYENDAQKLSYQCLFCNLLFNHNQFKIFTEHLLEHVGLQFAETEEETVSKIEKFEIDFVETNTDNAVLINNDTAKEREETKTIMSNIQSFSEYDANETDDDNKIRKFQCPYCEISYRRRSPLYSHLEKKHGIVTSFEVESDVFGKFPCPKCDVECCNKGSFILHVRRKHEDYFYSTLEKQQLKRDLKSNKFAQNDFEILINDDITDESQYLIVEDNLDASVVTDLHNESSSTFPLKKKSVDKSNDSYILDFNKKKKHGCPCCEYTNGTRYGIYRHLEKQHGIATILKVEPNLNGKYDCSQCGSIFDLKGNLAYHLKQKHEDHYYSLLAKQQEVYKTKQVSESTSNSKNNPYNTGFVDLTFAELGVRNLMNKEKKVHNCSHCSYSTGRANNLYRHLEAKHNIAALLEVAPTNSEGEYKCLHCSLVTKIKGVFIHHLRQKHRFYFCELLEQQQKRKDEWDPITVEKDSDNKMIKNEIIHPTIETITEHSDNEDIETLENDSGDDHSILKMSKSENNEFKCPYCEAIYRRRSTLHCHLEKKHGIATILEVEPNSSGIFECTQCEMNTLNKGSFIYHLKTKHKMYTKKLLKEKQSTKLIRVNTEYEKPNISNPITQLISLKTFDEKSQVEEIGNSPSKKKSAVFQNENETEPKHSPESVLYNCPNCEYKSKMRSFVCRHLESKHGVETLLNVKTNSKGQYHCSKCTTKISNKGTFIYHLKQKHENYYYDLLVQQQIKKEDTSDSDSSFEENLNNQNDKPEDNNILNLISNLLPVQKINKCYSCPHINCEFTATRLKVLQVHNREQHGDSASKIMKYQCPHCDCSYVTRGGIAKHLDLLHGIASMVIVEPNEDGKFHCDVCNAIISQSRSFIVHLKKSHKEYYYQLLGEQQSLYESQTRNNLHICSICGKVLPSYNSLKKHIDYHNQPKIECNVCGKSLSSRSTYNAHMKIHLGIRNYSCRFCDVTFIKKEVKDKHELRIHLKQRNYQCDECGQQFYTGNLLKNHMRRHNNERPEECSICHKRFFDTNALRMHKQTHSDVRKYECDVCGKKFNRNHHLKSHRAIHEEKKNFKCIICNMDFAQNAGLYSHMKNRHKDLKTVTID